jgi:hypothetical protein
MIPFRVRIGEHHWDLGFPSGYGFKGIIGIIDSQIFIWEVIRKRFNFNEYSINL